jgi:hypothetical protein
MTTIPVGVTIQAERCRNRCRDRGGEPCQLRRKQALAFERLPGNGGRATPKTYYQVASYLIRVSGGCCRSSRSCEDTVAYSPRP